MAAKDSAVPKPLPGDCPVLPRGWSSSLGYNNDQREWDRLVGSTSVSKSDRLLCLSPFGCSSLWGKSPIVLTGETEVRILSVLR